MINENNNYKRRTIPLRETLTNNIFNEMTENYPLTAVDGREYKQDLKYFSFPSDFDFIQFRLDCDDNDINYSDAFVVWSFLSALMCSSHGYYCVYRKSLFIKMTSSLGYSEEQCKSIIEALIEMGYLYNFDERLTNIPVVRTFECVQATRMSKRKYKNKDKDNDENKPVNTYEPKNEPKATELDEMKFFNAAADPDSMPLF